MIVLEILVSIPSQHRHEFVQTFEILSHKKKAVHESSGGRINRSIFECIDTSERYLWMERWTDTESLENYMQTDQFKALLGAIQILGELETIYTSKIYESKHLIV